MRWAAVIIALAVIMTPTGVVIRRRRSDAIGVSIWWIGLRWRLFECNSTHLAFLCIDSEPRSRDSYEDDYHYDGEREDSDIESSDPHSSRRYRDKERVSPTTSNAAQQQQQDTTRSTSAAGTTASARVKQQAQQAQVATKPVTGGGGNVTKKIDMGAASGFGKLDDDDLGINSPTHRHTHAEDDLFDNNNTISSKPITTTVFKTCPPPSPPSTRSAAHADFGDFNPREDENEFGDFASAFGSGSSAVTATIPSSVANVTTKKSAVNNPNAAGVFAADFGSAFIGSGAAVTPASNNGLLFDAIPVAPSAEISLFGSPLASQSQLHDATQRTAAGNDLLSDFGGLNMNTSIFNGEWT